MVVPICFVKVNIAEIQMASPKSVPDFELEASGVNGLCPAGEAYGSRDVAVYRQYEPSGRHSRSGKH